MLHQFIEKAKAMLLSEVKKSMGSFSEQEKKYNNLLSLFSLYVNRGFPRAHNFSFTELAQSIFRFVDSMQTDKPFSYRYAPSTSKATIYGSA